MAESSNKAPESPTLTKTRSILHKPGTVHPHPDHITFDEETIAEQMKEREENPKMKIDEPDTPYRYAQDGDTDEEDQAPTATAAHTNSELHARLVMAASALEKQPSENDGELPQTMSSHEEFEMKRKAVYADEGKSFKELLAKGIPEEEEKEEWSLKLKWLVECAYVRLYPSMRHLGLFFVLTYVCI